MTRINETMLLMVGEPSTQERPLGDREAFIQSIMSEPTEDNLSAYAGALFDMALKLNMLRGRVCDLEFRVNNLRGGLRRDREDAQSHYDVMMGDLIPRFITGLRLQYVSDCVVHS